MAKNKARFLVRTQWKSAILKHWWESRRGLLHYWPSSLVRKMLIIHIQAFFQRWLRGDRGEAEQINSHLRCIFGGSNDEPRWQFFFTSPIVRHVCGVRSLCKSCSGQSAASLVYSEQVEWRSSRWRQRGGASLRTLNQTLQEQGLCHHQMIVFYKIGWPKEQGIKNSVLDWKRKPVNKEISSRQGNFISPFKYS